MVEACRFVFSDGCRGYWHTSPHFIDLMVSMTVEAEDLDIECQDFPDQETVDRANESKGT